MKTWIGILLGMVMLTVGCAPGYSAKKSADPEETPSYQVMEKGYENPESDADRDMRIWREGASR